MTTLPDPDGSEVVEDPYDFYRSLRDDHPLYLHPRTGEYLLTRFADVQAAADDVEGFSSEVRPESHHHFASMDPPRHDVHRAAVAHLFPARRIAELEPGIAARCARLLGPLADGATFDIAGGFAALLPSQVITAMVGLPSDLEEPFRQRALFITTVSTTPAVYDAIGDLQSVIWSAVGRSDLPCQGILGTLLSGTAQAPGVLDTEDIVGICSNLVLAGTDTATNLITSAVVLLHRRPDLRRQLAARPQLLRPAVEELLRFESPVQWLRRRTTRPVRWHGEELPAGALVRLYWGAANRDERVVERPDDFDIGRVPQRHIAFGHGLHFCLGAALARLEVRVALRTLLEVAPDYSIDEGGLVRLASSMFRGYERVRVRTADPQSKRSAPS